MQKTLHILLILSVSRWIHLEVTEDPGAESWKLAVRRFIYLFISRRGALSMFINDNFKTSNLTEIKDFRSALGIKWKFILERSPW